MKFVTKLSALLLLSLSASLSSVAGTTAVVGHFRGPSNRQFNGYMKLQLPFAGAVDTTCDSGGSCMLMPTVVQASITNGVLDPGIRLSRNGDITPTGTYYRAAIYGSDGGLVSVSNFVIPAAVTSFDIGAAILTSVTTSNVAYANAANTTGTNHFTGVNTFSNINGVTVVDGIKYSTTDIGAGINAAIADSPNGGVVIYGPSPTGACYSTTTPIVSNTAGKTVEIWQIGAARVTSTGVVGTCINYTPTTATAAITLDYVALTDDNQPKSTILRDVVLVNNGCRANTGCGSLATAVAIGGVNAGAMNAVMQNVSIYGFGTGESNTNPLSPNIDWVNPMFQANTVALKHGTLQEKFSGGFFIGNGCVEQAASGKTPELYFTGTEFTENTGGACAAAFDFSSAASSTNLSLANVHLENSPGQNGHEIAGTVHVTMTGGILEDDTSTGTGDWMVSLGTGPSQFDMFGTNIISARVYTNVFLMGTNSRATIYATSGSPATLPCNTFFGGADAANVSVLITPLGTANPVCQALINGIQASVTVGAGTATSNGTAIGPGTAQAQPAITITGATTTDTARCALNAAPPATWQTGIVPILPVVTANTVTFWLSNPTAGSITPAATIFRCTVVR